MVDIATDNPHNQTENIFEQVFASLKYAKEPATYCFSELYKKAINNAFGKYEFLRFLNIWNDTDNNDSKVAFYADFTHTEEQCLEAKKEKFTSYKEKVFHGVGNNDFWGDFLSPIYKNGRMGNDAFEAYFYVAKNKIPNDYYHNSKVYKENDEKKIEYGFVLKGKLDKDTSLKSDFDKWLLHIENIYPKDQNDNTNNVNRFYFFISPCFSSCLHC
jgi:hypothetical protein